MAFILPVENRRYTGGHNQCLALSDPPPHKRRALHGGGPLHNGHASNGDSHKTQAPKCCELIAGNEERETVTPTRRNEQGENNRVTRRLMEFILPVASNCVSLASDLMPIHCHTPAPPAQCWHWQNLFHLEGGPGEPSKQHCFGGAGVG